DAAGFPMFEKIFDAVGAGVQTIFCVNNFFTITQNGSLDWQEAVEKITAIVQAHYAST
ncbi:NifU N-terminal domain-containing protein, partial [bacterium]|nr:NifU N-terminal domain-containing protein [bacterium]